MEMVKRNARAVVWNLYGMGMEPVWQTVGFEIVKDYPQCWVFQTGFDR